MRVTGISGEQKLAAESGEEYGYDYQIDMTMDNNMLLSDWRYSPQFDILIVQDKMQLISVYVMLCLYICIISLAAIAVMTYVRSVSAASDNQALFESLDKLGADQTYKKKVLKTAEQNLSISCGHRLRHRFSVLPGHGLFQ